MRPAEVLCRRILETKPSPLATKSFPLWRDAVAAALVDEPAWRASSERTRSRLLEAVGGDHGGFSARQWLRRGNRDDAPWLELMGRVREGVAVVDCSACGISHAHVPTSGRRYSPCGKARYFVSLAAESVPRAEAP